MSNENVAVVTIGAVESTIFTVPAQVANRKVIGIKLSDLSGALNDVVFRRYNTAPTLVDDDTVRLAANETIPSVSHATGKAVYKIPSGWQLRAIATGNVDVAITYIDE